MSEKLCLRWNDFQGNVNSAFGSLREDSDFADITLACEDGHQVEVHKVILAASSPFFKSLLKCNKHTNPLVYMRGVLSENLTAIVDFLYHGEANLRQENLESFFVLAEELKGFLGENEEREEETRSAQLDPKSEPIAKEEEIGNLIKTSARKIPNHKPAVLAIPDSEDFAELDKMVNSLMEKSENYVSGQRKDGKRAFASICKLCGKEGNGVDIKRHIEANHLEGTSLPCNFCENTFRSRQETHKKTLGFKGSHPL